MAELVAVATDYLDFDPAWEQKQLAAEGIEFRAYRLAKDEGEKLSELAPDANVLVVAALPITAALMARLPNLKMVLRLGVGLDNVDVEAATRRGVYVANMPTYCTREVAEHAVSLLFACTRQICRQDHNVRQGRWGYQYVRPLRQWQDRTLGVVGCGRIGSEVLRILSHSGLRFVVYDPYVEEEKVRELGAEPVDFDALLAKSDAITIHAPLTEETQHMFDGEAFSRMRNGAILVNTARGPIVAESALVAALQNGKLACAALDVTEVEPLPLDSPLRSLENVLLTPHMAWYSEQSLQVLREWVVQDLKRLARGFEPRNVVNPEVRKVLGEKALRPARRM